MPRPPIHPGKHLEVEPEELEISQRELAKRLGVPPNRISQIIRGERGISAETAMRLGRWLGTTPQYWLNLQASYESRLAQQQFGEQIEREVQPEHAIATPDS